VPEQRLTPDLLSGVWSATPTPLTEDMRLDIPSVGRLVEHHLRLGARGLFVAGTCGEGPWLPDGERRALVREVVQQAGGRLVIAVQVTDNSAARILANSEAAKEDGADIAVIAPPYFLVNKAPRAIRNLYLEAIRENPLPVGIYDLGRFASTFVPAEVMADAYAEPKVVMAKDSSSDPERRDLALAARTKRPDLRLFDGDEFHCVDYLEAGYDGLLLGGGVVVGHLANLLLQAVRQDRLAEARQMQARLSRTLYAIYGGERIECWLSGLKRYLVEIGVFTTWRNFPDYPLTDACVAAIGQVIEQDADVLLP
jgi:4-hydroxy-tetrahydrodipicolinate synthase